MAAKGCYRIGKSRPIHEKLHAMRLGNPANRLNFINVIDRTEFGRLRDRHTFRINRMHAMGVFAG